MQIEIDEIIEIPDYTDTARHKKLKNAVYLLAKKNEPFHMSELPAAEYKYYSEMWFIFKKLIAKEITPEQASQENAVIYRAFVNEQTMHNQRIYDLIEWNENIKKSEFARAGISKADNADDMIDSIIECIEALTNDKTLKSKIEQLKGKQT